MEADNEQLKNSEIKLFRNNLITTYFTKGVTFEKK